MSPRVMRSSVVLPEPLEPISAWVAPFGTVRFTSVSAGAILEALGDVLQLEHGACTFEASRAHGCAAITAISIL